MQRTREFQQKMHLHVDGIAGEDTLMQLMRETRTTPSVLIQSANISATSTAGETFIMSTITLAAQRSYTLNAPVWFSYRRPSLKKAVCATLLWVVGIVMTIAAGLYAHLYWDLRHPAPEPIKASAVKPETTLSDMHYVYVSKPFPQPEPKPEPVTKEMPPLQEMPIDSGDADWQQAPDGEMPHDISRDTLPGQK
jgi:hypothetical protein